MDEMIIQLIANIASGITLALIFFLLSDYIFGIPRLSGCWLVEITNEKTKYNPFKNMVLTYKVLIWLEGKNIYGSGEKVKEKIGDNIKEYSGEGRNLIKIHGSVLKKYLSHDKIVIHIEEEGTVRKSSTIYLLHKEKNSLIGKFYSTIADSEGHVRWSRQTEEF